MRYVEISGQRYPASVIRIQVDRYWNNRDCREVFLETTVENIKNLFPDGVSWKIIEGEEKDGNFITDYEQDCSDYSISGPVTDHRDGRVSIKMGKLTDREIIEIITEGL